MAHYSLSTSFRVIKFGIGTDRKPESDSY